MATVEGIRARLKGVFTEHQADVLAQVLVEVFPIHATTGDQQSSTGDRGAEATSQKLPEHPDESS